MNHDLPWEPYIFTETMCENDDELVKTYNARKLERVIFEIVSVRELLEEGVARGDRGDGVIVLNK